MASGETDILFYNALHCIMWSIVLYCGKCETWKKNNNI